jgi:hypothetical protein
MTECDYCGMDKPDVKRCRDPYAWEVNDVEILVDICFDCYTDRTQEI